MRFGPGTLIADGRYQVVSHLASGGTSDVYELRDEASRRLACKVIRQGVNGVPPGEVAQLEADVLARVHHPHVVRALGGGALPSGDPYLLMEFVEGVLASRLARRKLPVAVAVEIGRQLASALQAAHVEGVVHGDVKPSNVLVSAGARSEPIAKLLDFGVAKPTRTERTDVVVGTPAFMAPEQILGEPVAVRSDVYSACATIYTLLTGHAPFVGTEDRPVEVAALEDVIVPPTLARPDCPKQVERVLMRGLCKNQHYRMASARRLEEDLDWTLRHFVRQEPSLAAISVPVPDSIPPEPLTTAVDGERPPTPSEMALEAMAKA